MIFYESPQRVAEFLEDAASAFGARRACIVRELTKVHEEVLRGTLPELLAEISGRGSVPGEITVVVEGAPKGSGPSVEDAVREALEDAPEDASSRDLAREVSERTGLSRKAVYGEILRRRRG
jgi:16S rRNA (cytidine1402-2'-O)-methyltransferase